MLGEYLKVNHGEWNYKTYDCSRWLGGWIALNYGCCPLESAGIRYNSERSAGLIIAKAGGLLNLWGYNLDSHGFETVKYPSLGDIAIVEIPTDDGTNQTCGIWTGSKWATAHRKGLMFGIGSPLRIWEI